MAKKRKPTRRSDAKRLRELSILAAQRALKKKSSLDLAVSDMNLTLKECDELVAIFERYENNLSVDEFHKDKEKAIRAGLKVFIRGKKRVARNRRKPSKRKKSIRRKPKRRVGRKKRKKSKGRKRRKNPARRSKRSCL